MGYLTLRLRGAFFAIATLALAVVLQTLVVNWDYVGGSRGAYMIRPNEIALIGPYIQYLFLLMLALVVDRAHRSRAASSARSSATASPPSATTSSPPKPRACRRCGSSSIATTLSGALMGMAGAPFPYYIGYLAAVVGLRARIRRQFHRHADDRRHHQLGRTADRRHPAGVAAADRDRHHLLGGQPADRRAAAGRLRHHRAERHRRPGAGAGMRTARTK